MGRALSLVALVGLLALACSPAPQVTVAPNNEIDLPNDPPLPHVLPGDPLACVDRVALPSVDNAFDAQWSPDSKKLLVSRIVTIPNARMVTGYEEDQRLSILDVTTGAINDLGRGSKPSWSGYGTYFAYWIDGRDDLRIMQPGRGTIAFAASSQPNVRWVGDDLYFFDEGAIHVWSGGHDTIIANTLKELAPEYPRDEVFFSADATRFTMTRYYQNGALERYMGITATGQMTLMPGEAPFSQWSPVGHTLLLRSNDAISLIADDGRSVNIANSLLPGRVHGWTADGRLFFGNVTPTVPGGNAFDTFKVLGSDDVATLPNVIGVRAFSPDGRLFAGTTRTGLYPTDISVYRCGVSQETEVRADPTARSRQARIESDPRRFLRPVSGAIVQFVQGSHTGIDISAPYGAVIYASDDGVVDDVGFVPVGGRRVCVMHKDNLESCDYHTSLALVSVGQQVKRGQPVALVGLTGLTAGTHVHWEARLNGMVVDPLQR
jgi:hypothetical protein